MRRSRRIGGGGRRGEEDGEVCSQGTEGTAKSDLEDEDCKKSEEDGYIVFIRDKNRRDEYEEKSGRSGDGRRRTDQGGGKGPDLVDCLDLISPLSSDGYLYSPFDERKYSNRDDAGLDIESKKKKKEEEEESSLSAAQYPPTPGWEVSIEP